MQYAPEGVADQSHSGGQRRPTIRRVSTRVRNPRERSAGGVRLVRAQLSAHAVDATLKCRANLNLMSAEVENRLHRIVDDVVARAVRVIAPSEIWLYGSQARGNASATSDVDLAFRMSASGRANWARFVLNAQEEVAALVDLDLVDVEACGDALAREIFATGRLVYRCDA